MVFHIFRQIFFSFFHIFVFRVAGSPNLEDPGYATDDKINFAFFF